MKLGIDKKRICDILEAQVQSGGRYMLIFLTVLIAIIIFFSVFLSTPRVKGWLGELRVKLCIGKTEQERQYVINDFRFVHDGRSVQIDHVAVRPSGVYVIETKNYSGRIYGSDSQKTWTQCLAGGRIKNKFYSPVSQNQSHIYHLSQLLGADVYLTGIVVFVQNNTKYVMSDSVVPISALKARLALSGKFKAYQEDDMKRIYQRLTEINDRSITKKEHVAGINRMLFGIENNICPRCGCELVLRHGAYGDFYGCSGYPKCRFTKKRK